MTANPAPVGADPSWLESRIVERGLISERELAEARRAAERRNAPLEDALVELGLLTEDQVGMMKAEALGLSYVFPHADEISPDLVAKFPAASLREHMIIPLLMEDDRMVMATPRVPNAEVQGRLESLCGSEIVLSLASKRNVERVLEKLFPPGAGTPAPPARDPGAVSFLYGHLARALSLKATEVRFEPEHETIRVRYRIGGRLQDQDSEALAVTFPLMARLRTLFGNRLRPRASGASGILRTRLGDSEYRLELILLATRLGECALLKLTAERPSSKTDPRFVLADEAASKAVDRILQRKGLVLISSSADDAARGLSYELLKRTKPAERTILTIEPSAFELQPNCRQVETAGIRLADALEAALAYEPEVIYVGHPLQWPGEVAATLMAATSRLVLVSTSDASALDAVLRWLDCGAPAWLLSRVVEAMITVHQSGDIDVIEPDAEVRKAMERRASPQEIRGAIQGKR
jgi:type IV pilus assembly protein PilB